MWEIASKISSVNPQGDGGSEESREKKKKKTQKHTLYMKNKH